MNGVFPRYLETGKSNSTGAKNNANNYRPISVIPIFSRMLERLAHDPLFDSLKVNKKLTYIQSAFQKLRSTITSIISSTDYWYDNMDYRRINLTLLLDLKKAFDKVDHSIRTTTVSYGRA